MKSFLRFCLIFLIVSAAAVFPQQRDLAKDKVLYTIGYAHLDTEWRWDYQTTINEYVWNTMALNFRLLEKYPNYIFNFSGANRYRMMKEYYPREYETVKKWVAAGRWFPSGSSMEENDALAASHESIIRQILLGGEYFRKDFGLSPKDYILPDCFGFPASLPSILAHCGIKGFSTQKLSWGSNVGIPFNVGRWIGPDGESVVAALNPGSYGSRVGADLSVSDVWKKRILDLGAKSGVFADYMYYGTGDVGGSPTEGSVQWIEKSIAGNKDIRVVSARGDELFNDITPAQKAKLPAYTGEFLLTNHSAGSITSASFMKRLNRKNELLGLAAEAAASAGSWLGGAPYDKDKMNEAWRLVLAGQFHDILPGTSIPRAYEFAWNDGLVAANQFANILADASGSVARALDTRAQGIPLVVFNPLAIEREDVAEASVTFPGAAPKAVRVFGRDGREVPAQVTAVEGSKVSLLFLAKMPSLGYAAFDVRPSDTPCGLPTGLKVTPSSLENAKYLVKLDAAGNVAGIYEKAARRELLAAPIKLEFHYEKPEQWPAWNQDWEDRIKPPVGYVDGPAKVRVVENGPARVALEVEREARHSKVVQTIRLSAAGGADRVEFATVIDWATLESSLKAAFPLTVSNPKATYSFGVGTVQRGNNEPVRFEVPSHQWFDLTDKDGSYGVSVLEDCKYGSDKPADNIVRLTLMYTPGVRTSYREQRVQDFGRNEMLYALYGHKGDWRAGDSNLQAARVNQPLAVFQSSPHAGSLGKAFSFLSVDNRDVVVSAVKRAENGGDLVVRVVEAKGKAAKGVQLTFAAPVLSAREVSGQEQDLGPAVVRNGKLVVDVTPYHLRTFAVKLKGAEPALAPPQSAPVALPYNVDVISSDGHKADGDFDGRGRSFPAELIPDIITSEAITFKVGPKADGANNAVSCQSQTIPLPAGNYNRLYILAAAAEPGGGGGFRGGQPAPDAASRNAFKTGGASFTIPVEVWSGFYGQWDRRLWEGVRPGDLAFDLNNAEYAGLAPAYVRKDNIACFTTHRHLRTGDNEAYAYAYIYKYKIDLPAGAKDITLPSNDRVKILAMTAAANENDATTVARPLTDTLARDVAAFDRFTACAKPLIAPEKAYIDYSRPLAVALVARDEGSELHYTLDGTDPSPASPKYTAPLNLSRSAVVKAAAFDGKKLPSAVAAAFFSRSLPIQDIRFVTAIPMRRAGTGRALIDLARAGVESYDRNWLPVEKSDLDVVVDLGQVRTVEELTLGCLENHSARIFLPASVEISLSTDNKDFQTAAAETYPVPDSLRPAALKALTFGLKKVQARYVRVKAKNLGTLPKWHKSAAAQNPAAIMSFDEIIVQ